MSRMDDQIEAMNGLAAVLAQFVAIVAPVKSPFGGETTIISALTQFHDDVNQLTGSLAHHSATMAEHRITMESHGAALMSQASGARY